MKRTAVTIFETAYFCSIAALIPLMQPELPFDTKVFDYFNGFFIAVFLCFLLARKRLETRLLLPLAVIAFGSLLAMLDAQVLGTNIKTLLQELYLATFFIVLYNVLRSPDHVKRLAACWLVFAGIESVLVIRDMLSSGGERALGTFVNPNMAGNYLSVSLFFVFYRFERPHVFLRSLFVVICVAAIVATKSMSAALAALVGMGAVATLCYLRATRRTRTRLALTGTVISVLVLSSLPYVITLENYLDRLPRSAGGRTVLWKTGLETALESPLGIGIGPSGFEEVGFVTGGEAGVGLRKSLHNDYLAFLVERGVIGLAGFLCLLGTLAWLVWQSFLLTSRADGLWTAGIAGMFVVFAVDALSHEMVHYRHVWVAMALIASHWRILVRRSQDVTSRDPSSVAFHGDESKHGAELRPQEITS